MERLSQVRIPLPYRLNRMAANRGHNSLYNGVGHVIRRTDRPPPIPPRPHDVYSHDKLCFLLVYFARVLVTGHYFQVYPKKWFTGKFLFLYFPIIRIDLVEVSQNAL